MAIRKNCSYLYFLSVCYRSWCSHSINTLVGHYCCSTNRVAEVEIFSVVGYSSLRWHVRRDLRKKRGTASNSRRRHGCCICNIYQNGDAGYQRLWIPHTCPRSSCEGLETAIRVWCQSASSFVLFHFAISLKKAARF